MQVAITVMLPHAPGFWIIPAHGSPGSAGKEISLPVIWLWPQPRPAVSHQTLAHPELRNSCIWLVALRGDCIDFLQLFTLLSLTSSLLVCLGGKKKFFFEHFILIVFFPLAFVFGSFAACLQPSLQNLTDAFSSQLPLF